MRRSSPTSVLFSTYNLLEVAEPAGPRYDALVAVIRSLDTDVLAVQEVLGRDSDSAAAVLRKLAADAGLRCAVPAAGPHGGQVALAMGGHGFHVGLMWRDGIEAVPGSLRCMGAADFWHGLVMVTLDVGGTLVRHASFHAAPFRRNLRADQNELVVAAAHRPAGEPPVLIGADWNAESADRVRSDADEQWPLYEPADPYAGVPWFPDLVHQCDWDYDEAGSRRHWADRRAGEVLWAGGLHDAAAALRAPWQPTCGHHRDDVYGAHGIARRVDAIRVTAPLVPALRAHRVHDSADAKAASDHLPVTVEYQPG
jgi:endonuclease/exonuclease/phosphatase family metal-dependent hydrolase